MWCPVWVRVALVLSVLHNCYVESTLPSIQAAETIIIPENTSNGTVIGTLNATDADNDIITVTMDANTQFYVSLVHTDIAGRYTANITLSRKIDYESSPNNPILLSFSATDPNTRIPVIHQIQLFITDVNDNPPRFDNQPYSTQIPEDKAPGSVVFIANTTDTETGAGGQVYVSFAENTDIFNVSTSGTVTLNENVDYETLPFYHLRLKATDGGGLSSEADLFVTITDVQDSPPYFTGLPYLPKIGENHTVGSSFYSVSAQDGDRGNPDDITFSLKSSTCRGYFEIQSNGSIFLKKTADRDSGVIATNSGICMLTVQASEHIVSSRPQVGNRTTATETVTVTIEDINDNPPTFSEHIYNASILENSPPGVPITFISTQMTVEDKDQGDLAKFTLALDAYDDYFELVPSTVQGSASVLVKVKNSSILDYEQRQNMTLKIWGGQSGRHVTSATIRLFIENENDNSPNFNQSEYSASVVEGSPVSTSVATITAEDLDDPPFNTMSYSLLGADGKFQITSSGLVTVASTDTDRETRPVYYLTVEATDSGGRKETTQLTVNITDANDNPPQFNRDYDGYLKENSVEFNRPIRIQATDADVGQNALLKYSINKTTPSGRKSHFFIDSTTGNLSVINPLDYESLSSSQLIVVVRATDSGSPPLHTDVNITLTVQDINDKTPMFNASSYTGDVSEAAVKGTTVLQVVATDADGTQQNSDVFYMLEGEGSDKFQINGGTGAISVLGKLDRETVSQYNLTVTVMDRGTPPRSSTTGVFVDIDDVNDEVPTFPSESMSQQVNETTSNRITLYTVLAKDLDPHHHLTYAVLWNQSSAIDENSKEVDISRIQRILQLEPLTGNLILNGELDHETVEVITLKLHVVDNNAAINLPQTATATLVLTVMDVDDNSPTFENLSYTAEIVENSQRGMPISLQSAESVTVYDIDQGQNSVFSLRLLNHGDVFDVIPRTVRSSATVMIKVKNSTELDYEQQKSMNLTLKATETDVANPLTTTVTIFLDITDANDHDPEFDKNNYSARIPENSLAGHNVVKVKATDEDSILYDMGQYRLQGTQSDFEINSATGQVTVANGAVLDRETQPTYLLRVEAEDKGGRRSSVIITVHLTDDNDNPPRFDRVEYNANLREGDHDFKPSLNLKTTDADEAGTINTLVSYRIQSSPLSDNFTISSTGLLRPVIPIDYELLTAPNIQLVVIATDHGNPPQSSNVTVTIQVQDINDNTPEFNNAFYRGNVSEQAKSDTQILQVHATDADGTTQNNAVFYMLEGTGSDKFQINGATGMISVIGILDRETVSHYNLTVRVMDRGTPPLNSTADVFVDVDNVNDEIPTFSPESISKQVNETDSIGSILYTMSATDNDPDADLLYTVKWAESKAYNADLKPVSITRIRRILNLNTSTGAIITRSSLDREEVGDITLKIHVVDRNGATEQTATATLRLTVLDIDDNTPTFNHSSYTAVIEENSQPGIPISVKSSNAITVSDKDTDLNSIFSLSLLNHSDVFEVVPSNVRSSATVIIRVKDSTQLDYEKIHSMDLILLANETRVPNPRRSTVTISLSITDANDHNPKFNETDYIASIPENSNNGYSVVNVTATDMDSSLFGMGYYSLQGSQSSFEINNVTGEVYVAKGSDLDRETQDTYQLTVEAIDKGGRRSSVPITVTLTDENDNRPIFQRVEYNANLEEGAYHFSRQLSIGTTDADKEGTNNVNVSYTIQPSVLSQNFTISPTGILTPESPIDFESLDRSNIDLVVIATDHGDPPLSSNVTVTIQVQDINDNAPVFNPTFYRGNISENAATNTDILQVFATDADGTPQNSAIFYMLEGVGSDKFQINGATGVISKVGILDRETVSKYNLTVTVMDRGTPPLNSTVDVILDVDNVNDVIPSFSSKSISKQVNETTSTGLLFSISAFDDDPDSRLLYSVFWNESSAYNEDLREVNMTRIQGILQLNTSTGDILLIDTLDREEVEVITLKLHVVDLNAVDNKPQTATATLRLTVLDVDDNTPTFNKDSYTAEIVENSQPGIPITLEGTKSITVSDIDKDLNSVFSLSLQNHSDVFEVVPSNVRSSATVIIRVKDSTQLDYEMYKSMNLTLLANETRVQNPRSSSVSIFLSITDANDHDPQFDDISYTVNIPENSAVGYHVVNVTASDQDSSKFNMGNYSLQGSQTSFEINNVTGDIYVANGSDLDRETQDTYRLTVEALDKGGRRSSVPITVTLKDENDNSPIFRRVEYNANLEEGAHSFSRQLLIEATDADETKTNNSLVSYMINSSTPGLETNFSISETGNLTLVSPIDYELLTTRPNIELVVIARDHGYPRLSTNVTVTIQVQDINDNTPIFNQTSYTGNISEKARPNTNVLQVFATDADGTTQNSAVFYMLEGEGSDKFQINGATGVISKVGILDRETVAHYNLTVRVMDRGTPPLNSTADVFVDVDNVNDEIPTFSSESISKQVNETDSIGSILYTMSATDNDPDANLFYTLFWNECSAYNEDLQEVNITRIKEILQLNTSTGAFLLTDVLDREEVEVITLKLHVIDLNGVDKVPQTATATLQLTVLDIDDNTPRFNNNTYTAEIEENSQPGIPISLQSAQAITVSDEDKDLNSVFSLSLLNYSEVFEVVPSLARSLATVIIRVKNSTQLDYEKLKSMNLTLIANETRAASPRLSNVTIFLSITDANDHAPEFDNNNYTISIPENSAVGSNVVDVAATDKDSSQFDLDYYGLQGSQTNFAINKTTGEVYVAAGGLDRERQDSYELTVEAVDKGGRRSSVPITVTLTDENDNSPLFRRVEYNANLKEGALNFSRTLIIETSDADEQNTRNSEVSYSISSTSPLAGNFSISSNGSLTPNSYIDYELLDPKTRPYITLLVIATDHGNTSLSSSVTVTIQVQDVNDKTPLFLKHQYGVSIPENATDGSFVIAVSGEDQDGEPPNNQIMFVIDSGGSDNFRVDGRSGNISVQTGATLDREKDSNYSLVIMVIDQGTPSLSSSATVSVIITDVNDEPPVFDLVVNSGNVTENATTDISFYTVHASDPDEHYKLNFSILWDESSAFDEKDGFVDIADINHWFTINSTTGEVTAKSGVVDRETAEKVTLRVQVVDLLAEDDLPPQTATASLTVTIEDINDNYPEITQGSDINLSVSEGTRVGTVIMTLDATDSDRRQTVTFTTESEVFNITQEGRISLAQELDRETEELLSFTVVAKDNGRPSLSSTATINVTVLDTNDNDPNFTMPESVFNVSEASTNGTLVATLTATDRDKGPNADVTFLFAGYYDEFRLNKTSGEIFLETKVDRETRSSYSMTVIAQDNPTFETPRRVRKTITIEVTDVNDNNPIFTKDVYTEKVSEQTDQGGFIIQVIATDKDIGDNGNVWYSIDDVTSNATGLFKIKSDSGDIAAKRNLTGLADTYVLTVVATDMGPGNLTGNASVKIIVLDVNLNKPVFVNISDIAPVPECAEVDSLIYTFNATDADRDKVNNGMVQFKMADDTPQNTTAYFRLDTSGNLFTSKTLASETIDRFTLKVEAYDLGKPRLSTLSKTYIIRIKDTNDHPPKFNDTSPKEFSVDENRVGVKLGPIRALDPDKDSRICYTIHQTENQYVDRINVIAVDNQTAYMEVLKPFDRENVTSFHVTVTATDCSPDYYGKLCNSTHTYVPATTEITVHINDVNDNPPKFDADLLSAGIRNTAPPNKVVFKLNSKVSDPDTAVNSKHRFYQVNSTQADTQLLGSSFGSKTNTEPIKLSENGTVVTNMKFPADAVGFFSMTVAANDSAGTDVADLRIYIIADFQVLKITFLQTPDELQKIQDTVLAQLSKDTGKTFLVNDEITSVTDVDGTVIPTRSVLSVHAVEPATGKILDAEQSRKEIDNNQKLTQTLVTKFKVLHIGEADAGKSQQDDSEKQRYILIAIICLLAFTLCLIVYISCNRIHRYRRKLKAATIEVQAPARKDSKDLAVNINPIFNKEAVLRQETDADSRSETSEDSLDNNEVLSKGHQKVGADEQEITVNFFDEEQQIRYGENYLGEALRRYNFIDDELKQRGHDGGDSASSGSETGESNKRKTMISLGENLGLVEDLESTEI